MANKSRSASKASRQRRRADLKALAYRLNSLAKDKMMAYRRMHAVFKVRRSKVKQLRKLILKMQQAQRQRVRKRRKHRKQKARELFHLMMQQMNASLNEKKKNILDEKKKNEQKLQKGLAKLKKLAHKTPKTWKHFKGRIKRLELSFAGILPLEDVLQEHASRKHERQSKPTANLISESGCHIDINTKTKPKPSAPRIVHVEGPYKLPPPRTVSPSGTGTESSISAFRKMRKHLKSQRKNSPHRNRSHGHIGIPKRVTIRTSSPGRSSLLSPRRSSQSNGSLTPSPRSSRRKSYVRRRSSTPRRRFTRSSRRRSNSRRTASFNSWESYGRSASPSGRASSRRATYSSWPRSHSGNRGSKWIYKQPLPLDTVNSKDIIKLTRQHKKSQEVETIPITSWRKRDEKKSVTISPPSEKKKLIDTNLIEKKLVEKKSSESSNQLRILFPPQIEKVPSRTATRGISMIAPVEGYLAPIKERLRDFITRSMSSFMSAYDTDEFGEEENIEEEMQLELGGGDGLGLGLDRETRKIPNPNQEQDFRHELEQNLKTLRHVQYSEFEPNEAELQLMRTKEFQEKMRTPKRLTTTIFADDLKSGQLDTHLSVIVGDEHKEYKRVYQLLLEKHAPIEWADQVLLDKYARTPSRYNTTLKRLYDFRVMQSQTPYERSLLEADFGDTQSIISRRSRQIRLQSYTTSFPNLFELDTEQSPSTISSFYPTVEYDTEHLRKRWQKYFAEQEKSPTELLLEQKRQEQAAKSTRLKFQKLKHENRELQRKYQHQNGRSRFRSRSQSRRSSGSRKSSLDRQYTHPRSTSRQKLATMLDSETSLLFRAGKKRSLCSVCGLSYCGTDTDSNDSKPIDNLHLTEKLINNYKYLRLK